MLTTLHHAGVTELRFTSLASRAAGYAASAFLTDDGVLVDSAFPGARRDFVRALAGRLPRGAVITHHHEDHAGNVAWLTRAGVPVWLASTTREALTRVEPIALYRRFTWRAMAPLTEVPTPFDPAPLQLLATPGHTADHHVVWDPATRTVFAGDLFLGVKVRIAHHDEDPYALVASLQRVAALEPARLFCAHRGLVTDAAAQLRAKAAWHTALLDEVARRITAGESDARIVREVMGGESATGRASFGEYSRASLVGAVRRRVTGAGHA
jgi:glyoxylase-like metal-dependent hydrolase (beta-lactamase superfamily II)